jgi:hypothetical protein
MDGSEFTIEISKQPESFVREFWIKVPIGEQMLYHFWKGEEQPSMQSLIDKLAKAFTEWLEEGNNERTGTNVIPLSSRKLFDR